jgi:tetratricopeptide (TPR) repeat protein
MSDRWFCERKEILVKELVADFVDAWNTFQGLYRDFREQGGPRYTAWESWIGSENRKGPLWRLRDLSHLIVRRPGSRPSMYEVLLDWTLGSIFHECLKVREDVYQLTHPLDLNDGRSILELPEVREAIEEWEKRMAHIRVSLHADLQEVDRLFQGAWKGLKGILLTHREMGLLMRYLTENRHLLISLLGEAEWQELMQNVHPGGEAEVWYRAGVSYHGSGWLEQAREALEKVLEIDRDHAAARVLIERIGRGPG